jgi:hypothetical protein
MTRHLTKIHKKRISNALKGRPRDEATKEKIRQSSLGRRLSSSTKLKISLARKGKKYPRKKDKKKAKKNEQS